MKRPLAKLAVMLLLAFTALPAFAADLQVVDVMPTMYDEQPAISVIFDQPVDVKGNYDQLVTITKSGGKQLRLKGIVDKGLQIIYYVGLENDTSYDVEVKAGLKGQERGVSLTKDFSKNIKTAKLMPSAWFSSAGMVLVPSGKAVLPVTVSNLETVLVNFYRTPVDSNMYWFNQPGNMKYYSGDMSYYLEKYELIASKAYKVDAVNKQADINIDIPKEVLDEHGVYMAVMQYGGGYYQVPTATFIVSDIGLQIRKYRNEKMADIWVRSITTGEPMTGVKVKAIYSNNDKLSDGIVSDGSGYVKVDMGNGSPQLVVAQKGNQYAIVNMGRSLDFSEFSIGGDIHKSTQIYVYGPRDLYRGGETAKWNIIVRDHDGKMTNPGPVEIKVTNPRGQNVETITSKLDAEYGYCEYSLNLPDSAPTGNWNIAVKSGSTTYNHRFAVEDFMPETMRLTLGKADDPLIVSKATATKLTALGEYLYGAPAAQNRIEGNYNIRPAVYISDKWKDYAFGTDRQEQRSMNNYLGSGYLDDKGFKTWDISSNSALGIEKKLIPVRIQYQVTLYESGGRAVNRSKDYVYLPTGEAIGIKPGFNEYASTESDNIFSIININEAGEAVPAKVTVSLIKQERSYYWEYSSSYGWRYNYTAASYPVQRKEIDLGTKAAELPLRMDWGYYQLEVKNVKTGQTTTYDFYAGGWWWYDDSSSTGISTKPESLTILYDKESYKGGDTAKVTITSPFDGKGMLLVENGNGILWSTDIEIKKQKAQVNVPIGRGWDRHDTYVSAYITRPEKELEKTQKGLVFGINHLRLDRKDRSIPIKVVHPDSVEPGKDFEVVITTTERDKFGSKAVVTLAAVDQGILSLKAFKTPDAGAYFFRKLGYPALVLDNFWQVVHKYSDKMALRYGGDDEAKELMQKGGAMARADVNIVSIFTKPVVFDGKGEARIKMNIPSFNGELRMMAMAFSKDSYGMSETTMKVAEPIVTELNMPRFIATGDKITLALDMQNMTGADQNLTVTVKTANGLKLSDNSFSSKVKVEKGKKHIFYIPVEATGTSGWSEINVNVKGYKEEINKKWRLALRPPYPAVTISKFFTIEPGKEVTLLTENLSNYIIESALFGINIESMPPLGINQHLQHLLMYPYGCLEQTTSSTFPLLYATPEVRKRFGLVLPEGGIQEQMVASGIKMLLAKQQSHGGFGYWEASSYESPWGTVYAAELLNEASKLGFSVNQSALNNANNRLAYYIRNGVGSQYSGYYDRNDHFGLSVQCYAAYVLSKYGKASLSDVREVYSRLSKNGINKSVANKLPVLHIAVALKNAGDPAKAAEAMKAMRDAEWPTGYGYYGDYGSSIRDKAWSIKLMNEYLRLGSEELVEMLFELTDDINSRSWMSTQERLRLFQTALEVKSADRVKGTVNAAGKSQKVDEPEAYRNTWYATNLNNGIKFKSDSSAKVYAMAEFSAYSKKAPAVLEKNAGITRNYYNIKGERIDITNVKVGDYVVVELEFSTKKTTADGLVVDLLPAGFELENQNLDNSMKLASVKRPNKSAPAVQYTEYRDDRFIQAVNVYKDRKQSAWYIMRAVTPGSYTNPTPYFEDMYRDDVRAIGSANPAKIDILPK